VVLEVAAQVILAAQQVARHHLLAKEMQVVLVHLRQLQMKLREAVAAQV
jgi:hypothetical protein